MNFLRNLLAAILGCLIAFGICFVMIMVFASLVGNMDDTVTIKNNSVLELQLQKPINDYTGNNAADPFSGFFQKAESLDEILHAIQVAKNDDNIKGISINSNYLLSGWAQTGEIRKALEGFKENGKFVYAYGDFYMQKDYYLSSVADSLFINPVGGLDFKGLSTEVLFFKNLQEKTGIKMEVIRHGKYKSAVEPFLSNTMSNANRTQIKELIGSIWNSLVSDISKERNISPENLNIIADTLGGRTPKMAKASGLVDDLLFYDQYESKLKKATGIDMDTDLNKVELKDYIPVANLKKVRSGKDKIAVVYAQGEILYGEGGPNQIGQGVINRALKKAREDDDVKAIVLRVNSPGGSALTSDIIWREIQLTKAIKPVVVSMGDVAASGGYYISVGADKIFAEPTTITGSIGVFGVVPNVSSLAGKIGISSEQVGTNKSSEQYSLFEPMSDKYRSVVREGIENTYNTFLSRVAEGRNITTVQVDSLAQGRVWSGTDAKRLGLVDELGNLDDAIAGAASMVGLKDYDIKKFPNYKSGFERFMEDVQGSSSETKESMVREEIGPQAYTVFKQIKSVMQQKGVQARMPFALDIK